METELSADECNRRAQEFVRFTGTDEACAHFFLQDCDWDVQVGLNRFFETAFDDEDSNGKPSVKRPKLATDQNCSDKSEIEANKVEDKKGRDDELKVLSWNLDGLDTGNLTTRSKAVCTIVLETDPDVIFFQEVVQSSLAVLKQYLNDVYLLVPSESATLAIPYFTVVFLKRSSVELVEYVVEPFGNSIMGRNLLQVKAKYRDGAPMQLLCTHLESTMEHADERKRQLSKCFEVFSSLSQLKDGSLIVFGGDLNIRDSELSEVGIPKEAKDVWIECGADKATEYTWDCQKNDNKEMASRRKPRYRFDRVFFNNESPLWPRAFTLTGRQRIRDVWRYPSDHWGLLVTFKRPDNN